MPHETAFSQLANVLQPAFQDVSTRRALFITALGPRHPILGQINWDQATYSFTVNALNVLWRFDGGENSKSPRILDEVVLVIAETYFSQTTLETVKQLLQTIHLPRNVQPMDSPPPCVHILTSTKGGVGKTLVALALTAHYQLNMKRSLAGIDANTMNPDMSRILHSFKIESKLSTLPDFAAWQYGTIHDRIHILKPKESYLIQGGSDSFWHSLLKITQQNSYRKPEFDFLVDTNLHISNLFKSRSDIANLDSDVKPHLPDDLRSSPKSSIRKLLDDMPSRVIYLWIFWTWAAFHDIQPILEAANELADFDNRVRLIHVFNPSPLMPPNSSGTPRRVNDYRKEIENLEQQKDKRRQDTSLNALQRDEFMKKLDQLIDTYWSVIGKMAGVREDSVPGLHELSMAEIDSFIDFPTFQKEFVNKFVNLKTDESGDLGLAYADIFRSVKKRPRNVFPISVFAKELQGYTEMFARKQPTNIDETFKALEPIFIDLWKYLESLVD